MADKPVKFIRVGAIQLSVWENELADGKGVIRSISLSKSYKDGKGDWKTTSNFKSNDLPLVNLAINKAMEFLYVKEYESPSAEEPQTKSKI